MWTYGGVRIFLQNVDDSDAQTIARLGPLGGGTILHVFGYDDEVTNVKSYVVGLEDKASLKAMSKTGLKYILSGPYGEWGDYYLKDVKFSLMSVVCQTLRNDLPADSPMFDTQLQLYAYE